MAAPGRVGSADGPLRVRLLGGFTVEGIDERALGTRKARLFLKRLALARGRAVPPDELAAAVWGDDLPSSPSDQLSVLASRLRSVIGSERIRRGDGGYMLVVDWCDVEELEAKVDEVEERLAAGAHAAAHAAGRAALSLAEGRLLPEEDGPWLDEARPAVERLVARAQLVAAEAALAVGEIASARAAAQAALDGDPFDEAALRVVMRADAMTGRPGAALAAYASVRAHLADELGASPADETEQLHTAILRGELSAVTAARAGATAIVGRDIERGVLDGLFARTLDGGAVAVVIEAAAGMGKSSLVSAWTTGLAVTATVIAGRCDEVGADLPLQPVLDGLAAHLASVGTDASMALLGDEAAVLAPLLGRGSSLPAGTTTVDDAERGRQVLFASLTTVLRRIAEDRPLVLVVDDLHRAAPGTAELLQFALRRLGPILVLATRRPESGPDLIDAQRIVLGPLTVADAVALVGERRGPLLHERSDGHPLFLEALAAADADELPESILAAVRAQVAGLGAGKAAVETAACCGTDVDVDLVAAASGRSVTEVLDDLEQASRAGLLRPRSRSLAFTHELVREAIETTTSPARRDAIHRAAVAHLGARPHHDALALARHARLGSDPATASAALTLAAVRAAERFEAATAEALLDEAIELSDTAEARLARGRLRIARLDLADAATDAARAIELGAGVEGFELAGWVAYYSRDYDTAVRYADEGVARAGDPGPRASCLALSGRIRHTRGNLSDARQRLEEGVTIAPPGIRGMVQVWHAQLLSHLGEADQSADEARRGLLDPRLGHPFATGHGWFTLAYAVALGGHWADALAAVDSLDAFVERTGDQRFPPVAANARGWLLRGVGLVEASAELHQRAAAAAPGPTFLEAHHAALLDLTECGLAAGDDSAAAAALDASAPVLDWTGAMSWRHHNRFRLQRARLGSIGGAHNDAADELRHLAASAVERGDRRYERRALLAAATADARAGQPADLAALLDLVDAFTPVAGPEGWRDIAELAQAAGVDAIWQRADRLAAGIVAQATARPELDRSAITTAVRAQLDRLRP